MDHNLSYPIRLPNSPTAPFAAPRLRATPSVPLNTVPRREPLAQSAHLLAFNKEPEDACLTGGTRSLDRRLLALNLYGRSIKAKLLPARPAPGALACPTAA